MARGRYYGDFGSLSFPKKGSEIIEKCTTLRAQLMNKIEEREKRIREVAAEANMKDAADALLALESIAQGSSNAGDVNMNVGLAAKVRGEINERTKEREEVEKLNLIINNLPSDDVFHLNFGELTYFGF